MKKPEFVDLFVCWILNYPVRKKSRSTTSDIFYSETGVTIVSVAPVVLQIIVFMSMATVCPKSIWIIASLVRKVSLQRRFS